MKSAWKHLKNESFQLKDTHTHCCVLSCNSCGSSARACYVGRRMSLRRAGEGSSGRLSGSPLPGILFSSLIPSTSQLLSWSRIGSRLRLEHLVSVATAACPQVLQWPGPGDGIQHLHLWAGKGPSICTTEQVVSQPARLSTLFSLPPPWGVRET